jgi:hypothetical protein
VIVYIDTDRASDALVNQRLAYVALSRGQYDAQIDTNDKTQLAHALSREVSQRSAIDPPGRPKQQHDLGRVIEVRSVVGNDRISQPMHSPLGCES